MLANHGDEAVALAMERARLWQAAEDEAWAAIWTQVAEKTRRIVSGKDQPGHKFVQGCSIVSKCSTVV